VAGATGALGSQLLEVIEERRFPVADLVPIGTDRSLGEEVDMAGESWPVETETPPLAGLDLLFVCAPAAPALDLARAAAAAGVPCIDLSGALAGRAEVPLLAADLGPSAADLQRPLIATAPGAALAWALVLAPVQRAVGLRRVIGTQLTAAAGAGREGVESLQAEVVALFNQEDLPEPSVFPRTVAFDCVPQGSLSPGETCSPAEAALVRDVERLLGGAPPMAVTAVWVPTFAGEGLSLALETASPLAAADLALLLAKAPGVTVWSGEGSGPSTRDATGSDSVLVGRIRPGPAPRAEPGGASREAGDAARTLLLWAAADPLRLAASNAVRLAELRLATD
jgi:aspartate-semialdehyde dehydrogenase